jgi:ribosome maturation factor RimP
LPIGTDNGQSGGKDENARAASDRANKAAGQIAQIWTLVEPLCESEGFELVHVEFQSEAGGRILRLYIDKPGGVTLNDCVEVSRQVSDLLDVALHEPGRYGLEVSSPGLDRPIGKRRDFDRFKGNTIKIKTARPVNGRKNFKGLLCGVAAGKVRLEIDGTPFEIPFEDISRARLINLGESGCKSQT